MNFEEFQNWMKNNIISFLPEEYKDARAEIHPVIKLNDQYLGLFVRRDTEEAVPAFNMFDMYRALEKGEAGLADIAQYVAKTIIDKTHDIPGFQLNALRNYEAVKDHLFIRVSNIKDKKDIMERAPYTLKEDLIITYHIQIDTNDNSIASTIITNNMMETYGVSFSQLHKDAMENCVKIFPPVVRPLSSMIESLSQGFPNEERKDYNGEMLVITNEANVNGAAALFYPGIMNHISELIGGDYYILPSSIHECILLPMTIQPNYLELENMVKEVNMMMVPEEEQLGNRIYYYDSINRTFELANDCKEKIRSKNQSLEDRISKVSSSSLDGHHEEQYYERV
ncbi:MAG: DUF5688 family protein [Erysipelotrichaceae bacterium]|nr:DUF5688 family protein [Erysipelotrichaceae bacterium]